MPKAQRISVGRRRGERKGPDRDVARIMRELEAEAEGTGTLEEEPQEEPEAPVGEAPEPDNTPQISLTMRSFTDEDLDRLWDWIRQDGDNGVDFLGERMATSTQLRVTLGAADAVQAIDEGGRHVGVIADVDGLQMVYVASELSDFYRRGAVMELARQLKATQQPVYLGLLADAEAFRAQGYTLGYLLRPV